MDTSPRDEHGEPAEQIAAAVRSLLTGDVSSAATAEILERAWLAANVPGDPAARGTDHPATPERIARAAWRRLQDPSLAAGDPCDDALLRIERDITEESQALAAVLASPRKRPRAPWPTLQWVRDGWRLIVDFDEAVTSLVLREPEDMALATASGPVRLGPWTFRSLLPARKHLGTEPAHPLLSIQLDGTPLGSGGPEVSIEVVASADGRWQLEVRLSDRVPHPVHVELIRSTRRTGLRPLTHVRSIDFDLDETELPARLRVRHGDAEWIEDLPLALPDPR